MKLKKLYEKIKIDKQQQNYTDGLILLDDQFICTETI